MRSIVACIMVVIITSGCSYLDPILRRSPRAEEAVEQTTEVCIEETAALCGEKNVDVEVDINPDTNPSCRHCRLHCPTEG